MACRGLKNLIFVFEHLSSQTMCFFTNLITLLCSFSYPERTVSGMIFHRCNETKKKGRSINKVIRLGGKEPAMLLRLKK